MAHKTFVGVAPLLPIHQTFTYRVPSDWSYRPLKQGTLVRVPWHGDRVQVGMVISMNLPQPNFAVKDVLAPLLTITSQLWQLGHWLTTYYALVPGTVWRNLLPTHCYKPIKPPRSKFQKMIGLQKPTTAWSMLLHNLSRAPQQQQTFRLLCNLSGVAKQMIPYAQLIKAGATPHALRALVDKKILAVDHIKQPYLPQCTDLPHALPVLSGVLQKTVEAVHTTWEKQPIVVLHHHNLELPTLCYTYLLQQLLQEGNQALLLAPTQQAAQQLANRLQGQLGNHVYTYHGQEPMYIQQAIWERISQGKPSIIIGTGHALGLPFKKLTQIWCTRSHHRHYHANKRAWPWNVRHTALIAAKLYSAKVLLATPTPSPSSYAKIQQQQYGYVTLAMHGTFSTFYTINQRSKTHSGLAPKVADSLAKALAAQQQAIALHPTQGYAPYLLCSDCEWIPRCPKCRISLAYYEAPAMLRCHCCNYKTELPGHCARCRSTAVSYHQTGIDHLASSLQQLFPSARIGCFDKTVQQRPKAKARLYSAFKDRALDIIVGTPEIISYLQYDQVGWMGLFYPERLKRIPHFSASVQYLQQLQMVQLAAQACKRSVKVWLQTHAPNCKMLKNFNQTGYMGLLGVCLQQHEALGYPPYARLCELTVTHPHLANVQTAMLKIHQQIRPWLRNPPITIEHYTRNKQGFHMRAYLKIGLSLQALIDLRKSLQEAAHQLQGLPAYRRLSTRLHIDLL